MVASDGPAREARLMRAIPSRHLIAVIAALALAGLFGCGGSTDRSKVGPAGARSTPAPANGPIAYQRFAHPAEDDTSSQIYVRAPDGAVRRLTDIEGGASAPAWSPDGTRLAFESAASQRHHRLFTIRADGGDPRALADGCVGSCALDTAPAWSPNGQRVSFLRVHGPFRRRGGPNESDEFATRVELMVVDADGGTPRLVRRWALDPQPWDGAPRWSPDGRRLVLPIGTINHPNKHTALGTALHVLDVRTGDLRRITSWSLGAGNPDWSPDGRRIVFNSEGGHSRGLYVVGHDGRGLRRVLAGGTRAGVVGEAVQPVWSPDGRRIAFAGEANPCHSIRRHGCDDAVYTFDLWAVGADGSGLAHLTTAPQFEARPAWAPAR